MTGQLFHDPSTGAEFSDCGTYRFKLWRRWGLGKTLLFLMLNPSTADDIANDPTVTRCVTRTQAMLGFGQTLVGNIFALRSTDPRALYNHADPIGPGNDIKILGMAREADMTICGWGNHGDLHGRGAHVLGMLRHAGIEPYCLRMTGAGQPGHPLYIGYDVTPVPIPEAA